MLTGELKAKCIAELQTYVKGFQERRVAVTDELVADFFALKKLEFRGNPNPIAVAKEGGEASAEGEAAEGGMTKNQLKKLAKQKAIDEKKAAAAAAKAGTS
jgi:tryptophanyl-tRNA synthetase